MAIPIARPSRTDGRSGRLYRPTGATTISDRLTLSLARHWLICLSLAWGLFVGLPWLAPIFMKAGWTGAGEALYRLYSYQCHQLPQRSYFLFGPKTMYSLEEIQAAWQVTNNPLILREFVGNESMGWKVAWSDRMVSLYTSMLAGMVLFAGLRRRLPPLPIWAFALLLAPMAVDGSTHALSDLLGGGVGLGIRDSNGWLVTLTGNALRTDFYSGDAVGSFNWFMRLSTGMLMGLAVVWLLIPMMQDWADGARRAFELKAAYGEAA